MGDWKGFGVGHPKSANAANNGATLVADNAVRQTIYRCKRLKIGTLLPTIKLFKPFYLDISE